MRNKEVDDAINIVSNVRTGLMNFNELVNEHKDIIDSVEKVLSYISDLEKENMGLLTRLKADSLIDRDNYWKNKIRYKLIELSKKLGEPNDDRWEKDDDLYYEKIKIKIKVLKELLGE